MCVDRQTDNDCERMSEAGKEERVRKKKEVDLIRAYVVVSVRTCGALANHRENVPVTA